MNKRKSIEEKLKKNIDRVKESENIKPEGTIIFKKIWSCFTESGNKKEKVQKTEFEIENEENNKNNE